MASDAGQISHGLRIGGSDAPRRAADVAGVLSRAGFLAADDEARHLLSRVGDDAELLAALVRRRLTGEPLAWIVGRTEFCGLQLRIDPGVYVPRWHSEQLAHLAGDRLPSRGLALDLCTGCGAVAAVLQHRRPNARVLATDIDTHAVACARANGVDVYRGDLFGPLPRSSRGRADVVVAVVPYVPTGELRYLQRDTFTFESPLAYGGGPDGTALLSRVVRESPEFLRRGGALLLELGGDQANLIQDRLAGAGFDDVRVVVDDEDDVRGVVATLAAGPGL